MDKPKVMSSEELIKRAISGEGCVVDGATLLCAAASLLKRLDVLAGGISEALSQTDEESSACIVLEGPGLELFQGIFEDAKALKEILVDHGKGVQATGPASPPSPTVGDVGHG